MVSSVLEIEPEELVARLTRLGREHPADPAYRKLRQRLPGEWPF
jgi:hypothetical protein